MSKHIVAVAQTAPIPGDSAATIDKLIEMAKEARQKNVELVVFP